MNEQKIQIQKKPSDLQPQQVIIEQKKISFDSQQNDSGDQLFEKNIKRSQEGRFHNQQRKQKKQKADFKIQKAFSCSKEISQVNSNKQSQPYNINAIFYQPKTSTLYIPTYLRILVKNFKHINLQTLLACLNVTIILNTFTLGLPQDIRKFIRNHTILKFSYDESIHLNACPSTAKEKFKLNGNKLKKMFENNLPSYQANQYNQNYVKNQKNKDILVGDRFTIRAKRHAHIDPYVFLAPFGFFDVVLTISIKNMAYRKPNGEIIFIKINLLDHYNNNDEFITKRISFTRSTQYGSFKIATRKMVAEYSRQRIHSTLMQLKKTLYNFNIFDIKRESFEEPTIKRNKKLNINYAHFHIPLSRSSTSSLLTLFLPLWLFSILILQVFYMQPTLADRISIISTLIIAFTSLIPDLRQNIPPSPVITVFQILVYAQAFSTVLVVIQSIVQSYHMNNYVHWYSSLYPTQSQETLKNQYEQNYLRYYNCREDKMFMMTFYISIFNIIVPALLYFIHMALSILNFYQIELIDCEDIDASFENWTKTHYDRKLKIDNHEDLEEEYNKDKKFETIKSQDAFLDTSQELSELQKQESRIIFIHQKQFKNYIKEEKNN